MRADTNSFPRTERVCVLAGTSLERVCNFWQLRGTPIIPFCHGSSTTMAGEVISARLVVAQSKNSDSHTNRITEAHGWHENNYITTAAEQCPPVMDLVSSFLHPPVHPPSLHSTALVQLRSPPRAPCGGYSNKALRVACTGAMHHGIEVRRDRRVLRGNYVTS